MAHSKRNTSRAVFTSHERAEAKAAWTTSQARLTRESYLPFGSCCLCLEVARDPVSCHLGDVFCRECALANLLTQKKGIKRLLRNRESAKQEMQLANAEKDAEARNRVVKEFELVQAGLNPSSQLRVREADLSPVPGKAVENDKAPNVGLKRKVQLDTDELDRASREEQTKARKAMDGEKEHSNKLSSFWTPSLTPTVDAASALVHSQKSWTSKVSPICPASTHGEPHLFTQKNLFSLNFSTNMDGKAKESRTVCPSCMKVLSNASRPLLCKPCGHVTCRTCIIRVLQPTGKKGPTPIDATCFVCDLSLTAGAETKSTSGRGDDNLPPTLVELKSEGTGFSARGANKVEKTKVSFQC